MHSRLLTAKGLLAGACLLWPVAPLLAQRQVIATSVPVTTTTPAAPTPSPRSSEVQLATYVPEPPPAARPIEPPHSILPPTIASAERLPFVASTPANPAATAIPATMLSVEVVGPERIQQGQPLAYEIILRNRGTKTLAEIHVEQPMPDGVRVVRTEPPATARDHRLLWDVPRLEVGGERRLKVEADLASVGALEVRPIATFASSVGWHARAVRPPLSLELHADRTNVPRGGAIHFTIRLANGGEEPIRHLKLYVTLPPGMHNPLGPKMVKKLDDLQPNEARTLTLEATGVETGTFRNHIEAQADLGVVAQAHLDAIVEEPTLSLKVEGPKQYQAGIDLDYRIEVANPTGFTARNVRLIQTLPPALAVVSASNGASLDKTQGSLVWSLSDLNAGERQTVLFRCKASQNGEWPLTTAVLSQNLAEARVQTSLRSEEAVALRLEVQAREERLTAGTETTYRLHVFNDGEAAASDLRLSAVLPDALTPLSAEGPSAGRIDRQRVIFAPLTRMEGRSDGVYRLRIRARQPGKGILRIELTAENREPIVKEISIQAEGSAIPPTNGENANSFSGGMLR